VRAGASLIFTDANIAKYYDNNDADKAPNNIVFACKSQT